MANAVDAIGKANTVKQTIVEGGLGLATEIVRTEARPLTKFISRTGDTLAIGGAIIGAGSALANGDQRGAAIAVLGAAVDKCIDVAIEGNCAAIAATSCVASEGVACPVVEATYAACVVAARCVKLAADVWLSSKGYANSVGELAAKGIVNVVDPLTGPEPLASFTASAEVAQSAMRIGQQSRFQSVAADNDASMAAQATQASASSDGGDDGSSEMIAGLVMAGVGQPTNYGGGSGGQIPYISPTPHQTFVELARMQGRTPPPAPSTSTPAPDESCHLTAADIKKGRVCTSR